MKTVIIILSAVCIAVLLLTSCGKTQGVDDDSSADPDVSFEVKTDYIESYIYQAVRLSLPVTGDQLQAAHTHEGRIYLCFIDGEHDERQKAVFMSIAADGSDVQRTEIELNPNSVLLDFSVTVEGNIAVFILENNDDEKVVFYSEYNRDGYQELRRDFSEFFRVNLVQRDIDQAIISNRSIVVSVWNPGESELYLLCLDSEQHTSFELNDSLHRFGGIVRLPNENVAVLDTVEGKHTLREINFAEKAWGRDYPVAPRNYDSLFPASESSSFDILMSDGIYLYGYCTETRVQMTLLEWVEAGISGVFHVGEGHLGIMAKRLKRQGFKRFTLLADKGYYNGSDLLKMKRFKVKAIVSKQKSSNPKNQPKQFNTDKFTYDEKADTYLCPEGKTLHPHNKKSAKRRNFYNKKACASCPYADVCTSGKKGYRTITRSEYAEIYDDADRVFRENKDLYKLRQQIVEHPFGTIKYTMNGDRFLLRTRRKVRCEVALLCLGYNLKRAVKILGFKEIMARLDSLSHQLSSFIHRFYAFLSIREIFMVKKCLSA